MGLVDKIKAGAEQTANRARETAQEVQTKRELSTAYSDLGKTAFALADKGDISHADLTAGVDHIKELQSRLGGDGDGEAEESSE
jgi:F0F1-type ATP synthase membrane subunit b/b'